ncbi:hypothetical protein JF780_26230 [Mycobacterium intracellulare]|uniref:hypothetical protein n=1 Tax=Mycobacterium intracellulare TaxID=1767 RepID=UPI001CD9729B|nr:hypothetical protein [Mycobacterium intracellulare]MCA2276741.1 hypothetical protein [Mycobacterium intracellulare]MCA2328460.1 hypothetical protein [Mycobacterium intracellulare]
MPVARSNKLGGFWVLVDYAEVKQCHRDWQTFSSEPAVFRPIVEDQLHLPPLECDPPVQSAWRKVIARGFNATTPRVLEEALRQDVVAVVETIARRESCDLYDDYASVVPVLGMCRLFGLEPELAPRFAS